MKLVLLGSAAAVLGLASPASAQDESTAGGKFVAGAIVGVDSVNVEYLDDGSESEEDVLFGFTVGYDYQTESGLVVGIEGEYTDSSLGLTVTDVDAGARASINAGRDLYVGGRLGFRPGRNGLLYVKAGYTDASIEGEYDDGTISGSDDISFGGFRVGAGGEIDLGSNYGIRIEYRYSDYGEIELFGVGTGAEVSRNQGIVTLLGKF